MTAISPLYIDIHILQTVPPNNMNRDDAGNPKQAVYGGVTRSRVSSQAWKRAARTHFAQALPDADRATRTKRLAQVLSGRLVDRAGLDAALADRVARALVKETKLKTDKNKGGDLQVLVFFGISQLDPIADEVRAAGLTPDASDERIAEAVAGISLANALGTGHSAEVALFGRMVAELADLNQDASVQVAHAISTHAVPGEFDFYTAVDDEKKKSDEVGAGMMDTVPFNSATLYRFATIAFHQLVANLGGSVADAEETIDGFLDAFVRSMPAGHQSSYGNRTRPALVAVVLRPDQPVNLVSAFEVPVTDTRGVLDESIRRLATTYRTETERWGDRPLLVAVSGEDRGADVASAVEQAFGPNLTMAALQHKVHEAVHAFSEGGDHR